MIKINNSYISAILLLISLSVLSCTQNKCAENIPSYASGVEIKHIKGDSILDNASEFLYNPGSMLVIGDTLLILDNDHEFNYSLVSLSGDSIICRAGVKGEGPGQLIGISRTQIDSDGKIYIYDDGKSSMLTYNSIDEFISSPDSVPSIRFKDMSGGWLYKANNGYVGDNLYGDGNIFTLFDNNGDVVSSFGLVPGTRKEDDLNPDFYMCYQVEFILSPNKKYMCAAGAFHDWLAFFDVSGNTPKLIQEYYSTSPLVEADGKDEQFHLRLSPETVKHFASIATYNDGVFLCYIGASRNKMKEDNQDFTSHILKYNWNGELLNIYEPDEKIYFMGASPDGKVLYASSFYDNPKTKIFRFDLSD